MSNCPSHDQSGSDMEHPTLKQLAGKYLAGDFVPEQEGQLILTAAYREVGEYLIKTDPGERIEGIFDFHEAVGDELARRREQRENDSKGDSKLADFGGS